MIGVLALWPCIAWFFTRVNEFDPFIYRGGFLLLDVVCIVLIAVLVHPAARLSKVLAVAPLVWFGVRSYSHLPVALADLHGHPARAGRAPDGLARCSCCGWR